MSKLLFCVPLFTLLLGISSQGWAVKDCTFDNGAPTKSKVCELLEAETGLVGNLEDTINNVCSGMSNSGCDRAKERVGKLKNANKRSHGENDALLEGDYTEFLEGAYKGKGKKNLDNSKTCNSKDVDTEARDEFLLDFSGGEVIQNPGENLPDSLEFFKTKDKNNAFDESCNNWKVRVIDEDGERDGILQVSERQEDLCPTECKGKEQEVENKRKRFDEELDEALEEMQSANMELAIQNQYIASVMVTAAADGENGGSCPDRPGAIINEPISTAITMPVYIAMKAMEITTEVCKHPAGQDILGNNAASACTPLEVGYRIAKEAFDLMEFMNADFQSAQIAFIEACVDKMGDDISEIKGIVKEVRSLVITPQGHRASGDITWPNK